jgi:hypothetical protein
MGHLFSFLSFCYLAALSVLRLYSIGDRMINEYGAVGGMRIGRGNWSTSWDPAPVPFCPPQIPHDLTWDQTQAVAVRSQQLTTAANLYGIISSHDGVTIDGFWIDDQIYWAFWYSAWLHFTIHSYTHTSVHSHVFTSHCLVVAFDDGHSPSSGFLKCHPRLSYQLLTATAHNVCTAAAL